MPRRFAISDIHGCSKTFGVLLGKLDFQKEDELYLLGDYIDRGPDSKGVIDQVLALEEGGYQVHCLLGNHEKMMLDAVEHPQGTYIWQMNGGRATLKSFGIDHLRDLPPEYWRFLRGLDYYRQTDDYIFVHAGLSFMGKNPFSFTEKMIWIRDWYGNIDRQWLGGHIIVHGHTPIPAVEISGRLSKLDEIPAVNIDAGCVFDWPGMGQLCALDLDQLEVYFQHCIDN